MKNPTRGHAKGFVPQPILALLAIPVPPVNAQVAQQAHSSLRKEAGNVPVVLLIRTLFLAA